MMASSEESTIAARWNCGIPSALSFGDVAHDIPDAPTMRPPSSSTGEMVTDTFMRFPSFLRRVVS